MSQGEARRMTPRAIVVNAAAAVNGKVWPRKTLPRCIFR